MDIKNTLSSIVFLVIYIGGFVFWITWVYRIVEPRIREWLGQRLGMKINSAPGSHGTKWAVMGKPTAGQSLLISLTQFGFVVGCLIVPLLALLTILIAILAVLNGGF